MKRAEQNRLNPEECQKIIHQSQILVWKSNTKALRDYFSPAWLNFTGHSMEQEMANVWLESLHPDDADNYLKTYLESFKSHLPFETEYRLKRYDGKYRWMLDKAVPYLDSDGEFKGYIGNCFDITKQKQIEEALRKNTTRLDESQRIAGMGDFIWQLESGKIIWSQGMHELLGYDKSENIDYTKVNTEIHHPEDLERITNWLNTCIESGEAYHSPNEYRLIRKDGKVLNVQTSISIKYKNAKPLEVIGTCFDITKLKQAEERLAKQTKMQQTLMDLASTFINIPLSEVPNAINRSLANIASLFGVDRSYIFDYDWENMISKNTYEWCADGINPKIDNLQEIPINIIPQWLDAHKKGQKTIITNPSSLSVEDGLKEVLLPQGIKSLITVPLMIDEICIGFVGFDSVKEHRLYSKNEEDILLVFAQMLVNIKERTRIEKEKKQAEKKLQEKQYLLETAEKIFKHGSWEWNLQTNEAFWSDGLYEIYGRNKQLGIPEIDKYQTNIYPKDWDKLQKAIENTIHNKENYHLDYRIIRYDSQEVRILETKGEMIRDKEANPLKLIGVVRDVTELKNAEQELIESKNKAEENGKLLRAVAENFPNSYLSVIEKDFTIGFTSGQEFINQGMNPNDYIGLKLEEVFGEKANKVIEEYQKTFDGEETQFELSIYNQCQLFRTVPLYDENREITKILVVSENITEQKQRELELQQAREKAEENEKRLLLASQSAQLGIFDWDIEKNILIWDARMYELFGYNEDTIESPFDISKKAIHPNDQEKIETELNNVFKNGKDFETSFRIIHPDNKEVYIKANALILRDEKGNVKRMIGINRDITESKIKESMLEFKNKQLIDFSNIVAHNLRGPLVNIEMLVEVIETSTDMQEQKLFISHLKPVITHLNEVFNELVESLQIKQDAEIEIEKIVLNERLHKTLIGFESQITSSQADIRVDFANAPIIYYPKKYIDSIFSNLVSNALKYRSLDRKTVIDIRTEKMNDAVLLSITDNGLGIDMSLAKDKLFKIRKTFHNHPESKGFGLFMIKTQIETMGGEIWVESTPNKGSTFYVKFKNQK